MNEYINNLFKIIELILNEFLEIIKTLEQNNYIKILMFIFIINISFIIIYKFLRMARLDTEEDKENKTAQKNIRLIEKEYRYNFRKKR